MLEAALSAGICSAGADVISLGVLPTPGVAVLCRHYKAAGAVISASHNPYHDNGIKFFSQEGFKLSDSLEERIEQLIDYPDDIPYVEGAMVGSITKITDAAAIYLKEIIKNQGHDLSGLKIVVDTANGAVSGLADKLFSSLGAEVISIHNQPDGTNINKDCGSTCLDSLIETVLKEKADIGIAFDGDADRVLTVDEKGQIVDGDKFLAIAANHLMEKGRLNNNRIVITIMSNLGLTISMNRVGINVEQTKVGDRYVLEKMLETGAVLGGEQSGHIIFLEQNTTGDGLNSALYLLGIMKEKNLKLSQLAMVMDSLPQVLINVPVKEKLGWDEDEEIGTAINNVKVALKDKGRIIVRPSGTENLLRVMAEGDDREELHQLLKEVVSVIREKRGK